MNKNIKLIFKKRFIYLFNSIYKERIFKGINNTSLDELQDNRSFEPLTHNNILIPNTIFIRDLDLAKKKVSSSEKIKIGEEVDQGLIVSIFNHAL